MLLQFKVYLVVSNTVHQFTAVECLIFLFVKISTCHVIVSILFSRNLKGNLLWFPMVQSFCDVANILLTIEKYCWWFMWKFIIIWSLCLYSYIHNCMPLFKNLSDLCLCVVWAISSFIHPVLSTYNNYYLRCFKFHNVILGEKLIRDKSILLLFSPIFLSGNSFFLTYLLYSRVCSKFQHFAKS